LAQSDVISGISFEQFKQHAGEELEKAWEQKKPTASTFSGTRPVLLRVVIRSPKKRQSIWDQVSPWVFNEEQITAHLLEPDEHFKEKHTSVAPCHGFLIICDESAADRANSPDRDLEECFSLQYEAKDESRMPPAAVLYWPPPPLTSWNHLVRKQPIRFFKASSFEERATLSEFFDAARTVYRKSKG
jgi:hypothetical protein